MSNAKLKHAIEKDISMLKELLSIENSVQLDADDEESWDEDATSDLLEEVNKIKQICESQGGLNDKLLEWNTRGETKGQLGDDENTDPFEDENCGECNEKLKTKRDKKEGVHKDCEDEDED